MTNSLLADASYSLERVLMDNLLLAGLSVSAFAAAAILAVVFGIRGHRSQVTKIAQTKKRLADELKLKRPQP
jgi:hypothetical protein